MSDGPSPATARRLRLLRWRLAALLGALVLVVVGVFAWAVIQLDRQLRDEQNDATLLRQLDDAARQLAFDDGELVPADPTSVIDDGVAVAVRPDFDVFEILDEQDLWESIPEPDAEDIDRLVAEAFFELDVELQNEVLILAGIEDGDRAARIETLLADPPDDLVDEAYRIYLVDTADEVGVELASPVEIFSPNRELVDGGSELETVLVEIADGDETGPFTVAVDERTFDVRGTVLRDGPELRGAVVAFVDVADSDAAHTRFRNRILAIAAGLVVAASLAAWWLAGRSIRPTAAALGQQERFLAAAAHELRTPVAAIRATSEAPSGPDGAAPQLARVAELAAGASQLTDDLLTLARMDADRMELEKTPARLDLLVESIVDDDPAYALTVEPVIVDGDVALLTRAIENLLRNAKLHGGATAESPAVVVVAVEGVTVSDRGPGIAEADRDAVFERFRSGARSTGHGLGLPLARWIARAHGGELSVVPSPTGATLALRLPDGRAA